MAQIILGLGSSHAPQLHLTPAGWWRRAEGDKLDTEELWFRGRPHNFNQLAEVRSAERLEKQIEPDLAELRYQACQRAIGVLAERLAETRPDVCVIVGDDQEESFLDDNMPAISVYWGETVDTAGAGERRPSGVPGRDEAMAGAAPRRRLTHPCEPDLGRHIIQSLIADEIDVAHSRHLPAGRHGNHAIGHAFTYVYGRLMHDEVTAHVPIFLNTYFPPNQPSMRRCYQFGRALRRAVESWDSPKTVALIASGGLSHKVIEEDLDDLVLKALKSKDESLITVLPSNRFMSGTSEIRNWAVVAGAMAESDMEMSLIDYVPCYRSSAGTGCGMGFAEWQ
jgi:hypothetical protein